MTSDTAHWLSPKVVLEEFNEGRGRTKVLVVFDSKDVIVNQFSSKAIPVAEKTQDNSEESASRVGGKELLQR